jgi:hypothetical protein
MDAPRRTIVRGLPTQKRHGTKTESRTVVRHAAEERMSATITSIAPSPRPAVDAVPAAERWPACRTAWFIILVCGAFWLAVGGLVALMIGAF